MRQKTKITKATLPVVLKGSGCVLCPALRYRYADEQRYCVVTGEVIEHWKAQRGQECRLENITIEEL